MGEHAARAYKCYSEHRGRHIIRKTMRLHEMDLYTAFLYAMNTAADHHRNMVDYMQHVDMLEVAYLGLTADGYEGEIN